MIPYSTFVNVKRWTKLRLFLRISCSSPVIVVCCDPIIRRNYSAWTNVSSRARVQAGDLWKSEFLLVSDITAGTRSHYPLDPSPYMTLYATESVWQPCEERVWKPLGFQVTRFPAIAVDRGLPIIISQSWWYHEVIITLIIFEVSLVTLCYEGFLTLKMAVTLVLRSPSILCKT